jgi:Fe-S oxidoreductase
MPPDLKYKEEGEIGYWVGCSSSFNKGTRNLAVNTMRILNKAGIEPTYLGPEEWCCGGPAYVIGCIDELFETVEHNINELSRRGIRTLITSCSGCWLHLSHFYPLFAQRQKLKYDLQVRHVTEMISDLIEDDRIRCKFPIKLKVTYHDPCHIGRGGGIVEPPRKILASIPGLELIEMYRNRDQASCCGRHLMRYPRLGIPINKSRIMEAKQTGAPALVGACPTCETNFRIGITEIGTELEVFDITDLVAESMGLPTLIFSKLDKLAQN